MILDSCEACLRRAFLIAHLAPRIAGLLGSGDRRARGLLGLCPRTTSSPPRPGGRSSGRSPFSTAWT